LPLASHSLSLSLFLSLSRSFFLPFSLPFPPFPAFILIEDKVEHVRRLNGAGRAARGAGDAEKAKRLYEYGLAINPHCVTCLKNLGEVLMSMDRPSEAEVPFRRALELTPRDSDAMYNLGGTLKALGRVEEAVNVYYQAVEINDDDWELCYNLGVALGDLKRFVRPCVFCSLLLFGHQILPP
jgi:tetratricopeptide (TPR) repeat protein